MFYKFPHATSGRMMLGSTLAGNSGGGTLGIIPGTGNGIGAAYAFATSPVGVAIGVGFVAVGIGLFLWKRSSRQA